ncbi:MAG: Asp-tRNA(Asn)/Glu-tRNA(Gln) amidotransferase subunit GatC [Bacteroidia bacterium]|jgi:aspartyl-tRNA(Asn)/glutamyl-tRNA(Gln) amidotransferase subunit C|nr:Asp-tRNA(Asn)/Glu-tRNA(Gln) amidotransferase subunit GatC [Bacteroidia bacterium]
MTVDEHLIGQLANLAKLEFEAEAKTEIIKDLNRILSFVEKLNEIDTDGIEPLIYLVDDSPSGRDDIAHLQISQDEGLQNAPKHDSDYFRVPKVIS